MRYPRRDLLSVWPEIACSLGGLISFAAIALGESSTPASDIVLEAHRYLLHWPFVLGFFACAIPGTVGRRFGSSRDLEYLRAMIVATGWVGIGALSWARMRTAHLVRTNPARFDEVWLRDIGEAFELAHAGNHVILDLLGLMLFALVARGMARDAVRAAPFARAAAALIVLLAVGAHGIPSVDVSNTFAFPRMACFLVAATLVRASSRTDPSTPGSWMVDASVAMLVGAFAAVRLFDDMNVYEQRGCVGRCELGPLLAANNAALSAGSVLADAFLLTSAALLVLGLGRMRREARVRTARLSVALVLTCLVAVQLLVVRFPDVSRGDSSVARDPSIPTFPRRRIREDERFVVDRIDLDLRRHVVGAPASISGRAREELLVRSCSREDFGITGVRPIWVEQLRDASRPIDLRHVCLMHHHRESRFTIAAPARMPLAEVVRVLRDVGAFSSDVSLALVARLEGSFPRPGFEEQAPLPQAVTQQLYLSRRQSSRSEGRTTARCGASLSASRNIDVGTFLSRSIAERSWSAIEYEDDVLSGPFRCVAAAPPVPRTLAQELRALMSR